MSRDLIITGVPRSGTTLTTALIDSLPDSVGLNEPQWHSDWIWNVETTALDFAKWLVGDFAWIRHQLLSGKSIPDRRKSESGEAVTDYYKRKRNEKVENTYEVIDFKREGLSKDFLLASKHNGLYVGALKPLCDIGHFEVLVVLRHPLDAIMSWRSLPSIPLYEGNMPGALRFWIEMREVVVSDRDVLDKQVELYELLCKRYYKLKKRVKFIRYEDILEDPNVICRTLGMDETLKKKGVKARKRKVDEDELEKVTAKLREKADFIRHFYDDF